MGSNNNNRDNTSNRDKVSGGDKASNRDSASDRDKAEREHLDVFTSVHKRILNGIFRQSFIAQVHIRDPHQRCFMLCHKLEQFLLFVLISSERRQYTHMLTSFVSG